MQATKDNRLGTENITRLMISGVLHWRPLHWDREIGNGQKGSWETVFLCFCSLP